MAKKRPTEQLKLYECSLANDFDDAVLGNIADLVQFLREAEIFADQGDGRYSDSAIHGRYMVYGLIQDGLRHVERHLQLGRARVSTVTT